jgi:hypothetical protein
MLVSPSTVVSIALVALGASITTRIQMSLPWAAASWVEVVPITAKILAARTSVTWSLQQWADFLDEQRGAETAFIHALTQCASPSVSQNLPPERAR